MVLGTQKREPQSQALRHLTEVHKPCQTNNDFAESRKPRGKRDWFFSLIRGDLKINPGGIYFARKKPLFVSD
jgi:hypothetical protein